MVCNFLMLSFKAVIPIRHIGCPLVILIIPLVCEVLLRLTWRQFDRLECQGFMIVTKATYFLVKFFSVLNVCLKLDKTVSWNWNTVFWPIWLSVIVIALATLAFAFLFAGTVFSWMLNETSGREVLTSAWVLVCSLNFTVCFATFFMLLSEMLQKDTSQPAPFAIPLGFTVFFSVSLCFITGPLT